MPAKRLMLEIVRLNQRCIAETGNIDPARVAALIETALVAGPDRHRLILGLSEYLASAAAGMAPELDSWVPLEDYPHLTIQQ